jgi:hypothetical protein
MPRNSHDALSAVHIMGSIFGIFTCKKSAGYRVVATIVQLSLLIYVLQDLIYLLFGGNSLEYGGRSTNAIIALTSGLHKLLFIILLFALIHFNCSRNCELNALLQKHDDICASFGHKEEIIQKIQYEIRAMCLMYNVIIAILHLLDHITFGFDFENIVGTFISNLITTYWVNCEIIFLSIVCTTREMFSNLNSEIQVNGFSNT